jgi:hypothetical protein
MAVVEVHATGERFEGVTGSLLGYYQGEANTVGGLTIDGVAYPAKIAESDFDPAAHTVVEVQEHLASATPGEQARVLDAEADSKARVSLVGEPDQS